MHEAPRLLGRFRPPGDKSISHRSLILASLASGTSFIRGLNPGADVRSSRMILAKLGARIEMTPDGCQVVGTAGKLTGGVDLDCGNSGTTMRLLLGALAGRPGSFRLYGDASLSARPMGRVAEPLRRLGAILDLAADDRPPIAITGMRLAPFAMPETVRSAQVKSALLLAGLTIPGAMTLIESVESRDHTERMLTQFGAKVERFGRTVSLIGPVVLSGTTIDVPGDPSAAAFALTGAAILPGSSVTAESITVNPTRRSWLDILGRMGARVTILMQPGPEGLGSGQDENAEPVANVTVEAGELSGVTIGGDEAALAMDELPVLAVAACCALGATTIRDAAELRVKESDRISGMARGLAVLGARIEELPDGLVIHGGGPGFRFRAGRVDSLGDHRLAMAFRIAGLKADGPVVIDDVGSAGVSDPAFEETVAGLLA
ncbi:MAG: 3-phosphoshikimate 1-carboxyvinyltransferase [Candidatus Eisenbacteria bacterium]|nr:3-phosphoshikimate 1-carboxyvinyltransferase [Candidatus Eisenbacteria bacterium]